MAKRKRTKGQTMIYVQTITQNIKIEQYQPH